MTPEERQDLIDKLNNPPVTTYELQQAMGDFGRLLSLMERVRNQALEKGFELARQENQITRLLQKERFVHELKSLKLEQKSIRNPFDENDYRRGLSSGQVGGWEAARRKINNKIERIICLLNLQQDEL